MTVLAELSAAIRTVHESAGPAVVGIGRRIRGSGAVIGPNRVLTNAHNLRGEEVTVTFADGRSVTGRVLGIDGDGDLAVVDADTGSAPAIAWSATAAAVGDVVFGLAATGPGAARITAGTVSAVGQSFRGPAGSRIGGSLEHTAPLAPGSSGGPLVDGDGRLVAINTNRAGEGFYLARPADAALQARVDALARGESVRRPRLGIAVAPSSVARRLRRSVVSFRSSRSSAATSSSAVPAIATASTSARDGSGVDTVGSPAARYSYTFIGKIPVVRGVMRYGMIAASAAASTPGSAS